MLQSLGSPEALLGMIAESGGAGLAPVVAFDGHEVGPAEWVVREWFLDGFAPLPRVLRVGDRALLQHPAAVRDARRGRRRKRARATAPRVRVPRPLVPRRRDRDRRVLRDAHPGAQRAARSAAGDGRRPRVRRRPRAGPRARRSCSAARTISAPIFVLALEALPSRRQARVRGWGSATTRPSDSRASCSPSAHDDDERYLVVEVRSQAPPLRPARARSTRRPLLPAGTRRARRPTAGWSRPRSTPQRRVEDARRQARDRARTARAVELAGRHRAPPTRWPRTSPAPSPRSSAATAPRSILFEPGAEIGRVVATARLHASTTTCACTSMEVPVAQIRAGRRRRERVGPRDRRRPRHALAPDGRARRASRWRRSRS